MQRYNSISAKRANEMFSQFGGVNIQPSIAVNTEVEAIKPLVISPVVKMEEVYPKEYAFKCDNPTKKDKKMTTHNYKDFMKKDKSRKMF